MKLLIHKYFAISSSERWLFVKAVFISLGIKIMVTGLPVRIYARFFRKSISGTNPGPADLISIERIIRAVHRCSRYTPWTTLCLVDAITARILLNDYKIQSTLFFGVSRDRQDKLIAHAWLKCGDIFITGKKGYRRFTVVSSFA